jgi:hypothetical protein
MSALQLFVGAFGLAAVAVSLLAVWRVARTPGLRFKAVWIVGCLFGFVGFAVNWSAPGDLYLEFGVQIPVVLLLWPPGGGPVVVRAMFPLVAVVALARSRRRG